MFTINTLGSSQLNTINNIPLKTNISLEKVKKIRVGIIDSGLIHNFPGISMEIISNEIIKQPTNMHGMFVSGIIASKKIDGLDYLGVIPGIDLIGYNLADTDINAKSLAEAITILSKRVDIINISMGTFADDPTLFESIKTAIANGVTIICSAGNSGSNQYNYPASFQIQGLISVGALDEEYNILQNSTYNDRIDIYVPGESIPTISYTNGKYLIMNQTGTSLAAPVATALAILLKAKYPKFSPKDIESKIISSSIQISSNWKHERKKVRIINFESSLS